MAQTIVLQGKEKMAWSAKERERLALKEFRFQRGGGRDRLKAAAKIPWGVSLQTSFSKLVSLICHFSLLNFL